MNSFSVEIIAGGIPAIKTLSCDIQVEWEEIGTHMGLEASILKQIKQTNVSQVKECCMDVFVAWLNQHKQATWEDLLALLQVPSLEWNMIAKGLVHHLHGTIYNRSFIRMSICGSMHFKLHSLQTGSFL